MSFLTLKNNKKRFLSLNYNNYLVLSVEKEKKNIFFTYHNFNSSNNNKKTKINHFVSSLIDYYFLFIETNFCSRVSSINSSKSDQSKHTTSFYTYNLLYSDQFLFPFSPLYRFYYLFGANFTFLRLIHNTLKKS